MKEEFLYNKLSQPHNIMAQKPETSVGYNHTQTCFSTADADTRH